MSHFFLLLFKILFLLSFKSLWCFKVSVSLSLSSFKWACWKYRLILFIKCGKYSFFPFLLLFFGSSHYAWGVILDGLPWFSEALLIFLHSISFCFINWAISIDQSLSSWILSSSRSYLILSPLSNFFISIIVIFNYRNFSWLFLNYIKLFIDILCSVTHCSHSFL